MASPRWMWTSERETRLALPALHILHTQALHLYYVYAYIIWTTVTPASTTYALYVCTFVCDRGHFNFFHRDFNRFYT